MKTRFNSKIKIRLEKQQKIKKCFITSKKQKNWKKQIKKYFKTRFFNNLMNKNMLKYTPIEITKIINKAKMNRLIHLV